MFKNNIFIISFVTAIIIAIAAWFFYQNNGRVDGNIWEMIPADAALIIEIDDPEDFYNRVSNSSLIWQSLLNVKEIESFNKNIIHLDSLLNKNTDYSKLFWDNQVTIAFYPDPSGKVEILLLSNIERSLTASEVKKVLKSELGSEYLLVDIAKIPNSLKIVSVTSGITSYLTFVDGVFIYSSSVNLLSKLNNTYNGNDTKITDDLAFVKLKNTAGKKVHGRAYFQYNQIWKIFASVIIPEQSEVLNWVKNFATWTEVDILLKEEELIFSGFSMSEVPRNYLNKLKGQQPVKLKATSVIPYNTNVFMWLGLTNFWEYYYNSNSESRIKSTSSKINIDIVDLLEVVGNEIVFASSSGSSASFKQNSWLFVNIVNQKSAAKVLKRIAQNTGSKKVIKHNNYEISKINNESFVPDVFGDAFAIIKNNYYTFIGDYVVFANSESSLINLINFFETGKTLDLNDNFKSFTDNISSKSNLLLYIKPGSLLGRRNEYLTGNIAKQLELNKNVVGSFQGIAMQVSVGDDLSYTSFYIKHGKTHHEEDLALWKVHLDDEIVWGPYLVNDHQTKKENIIIFDKLGNVYLINSDGNIMWKKKLDAVPMSNIFQVDYYKNGKIQYLFSTENFIYLIDKKGRSVTGFPKKLHSTATNGVVVFDYLNNRDYRLLVAQSDKRVYNYTIKGKEVKGWKQPRMQNVVTEPITRLLANKKDYIIISDIENEIKIVDRKGKRRIKLSGSFSKAKHSNYYVNRTNSKGIIITTDEKGQLVYISSSGKLKYTNFGSFSPEHFFLYEDFNGDNSEDFIFIDGNSLKVFDRFKKELFSYKFVSEITIKPSFFNIGKKQHVLGVVADKERTIYLFDNKGNIIISKGLVGETPFTVGDLDRNNKINLISAAGSTLYNYRLK